MGGIMSSTKKTLGQAIDEVIAALEALDDASRRTAVHAACEHLGLSDTPISSPDSGEESSQQKQSPPSTMQPTKTTPVDIRSLKERKKPKTAQEMACLVAYYLESHAPTKERKSDISKADLEKYFKQANDINPHRNLYNLGLTHYYKGEFIKAANYFEREIAFNPNNMDAYFWGGRSFYISKNTKKAEEYYRKCVEFAPDNFSFLLALSEALFSNRKFEESYDTISKALEILPNNKPAQNLRNTLKQILMSQR